MDFLLLMVLLSNIVLYNTQLGTNMLPAETKGVVFGSLLDLIIVLPILFMLSQRKFSIKTAILTAATGCILARVLIPNPMLKPFMAVTWAGVAIEVVIIAFELMLIVTFVRYLPKILSSVKESRLPTSFAFPEAVNQYVKRIPLFKCFAQNYLCSIMLYLLGERRRQKGLRFTKTLAIWLFMLMIIHAIIIETLGFHWWLHEKSMILSIVLLVLNVYSVFTF